jgi:hypothetical protein
MMITKNMLEEMTRLYGKMARLVVYDDWSGHIDDPVGLLRRAAHCTVGRAVKDATHRQRAAQVGQWLVRDVSGERGRAGMMKKTTDQCPECGFPDATCEHQGGVHEWYCPECGGSTAVVACPCDACNQVDLEQAIGNYINQAPMPNGLNGPVGDEAV